MHKPITKNVSHKQRTVYTIDSSRDHVGLSPHKTTHTKHAQSQRILLRKSSMILEHVIVLVDTLMSNLDTMLKTHFEKTPEVF